MLAANSADKTRAGVGAFVSDFLFLLSLILQQCRQSPHYITLVLNTLKEQIHRM